ncbi:Uncharacterised protein [Mycobacteroides abscessus subsp. abscessus]|nr:Uncharacterised protein [Mycobacteroides abscessus subsp. abscessus]
MMNACCRPVPVLFRLKTDHKHPVYFFPCLKDSDIGYADLRFGQIAGDFRNDPGIVGNINE